MIWHKAADLVIVAGSFYVTANARRGCQLLSFTPTMLSATHTSVARPPARYTALARRVPQVRTRAISSIIDGYNVSIDVVLAKAGDVEAPIAVPVVIGAVVAVSLTAAIPFFLKSGQLVRARTNEFSNGYDFPYCRGVAPPDAASLPPSLA